MQQLKEQYETRIDSIKQDRQAKVSELRQQLDHELHNVTVCKNKIKETMEKFNTAKKMMEYKNDDLLCKKSHI